MKGMLFGVDLLKVFMGLMVVEVGLGVLGLAVCMG